MTNKQLLSERLAETRKTFTGHAFDWMTGYGLTRLISDVRALEGENQRLKEQCSATSLDKEICPIRPLHEYDKLLNNFEREMRAEVATLRREREGSDLALERDYACAERDALRAEMETLQRDKDGRIREAFDRMSVAIRERDEASAELVDKEGAYHNAWKMAHNMADERDALRAEVESLKNCDAGVATLMYAQAVRERDEARAELIDCQANQSGRNSWFRMRNERDAALAKLAAVREMAKAGTPSTGGWADWSAGFNASCRDALAIIDTAPVAADTEAVTREVWLRDDGRAVDSDYVHESTGGPRATVTFYVPKPKPPPVVEAFETEC